MYVENGMKVVNEIGVSIVENVAFAASNVQELVLTLFNKSEFLKTGMALIGSLFVLNLFYSIYRMSRKKVSMGKILIKNVKHNQN